MLVLKQVRTWFEGAISVLRDCFEHTDWNMSRGAATCNGSTDLKEYTAFVTEHISKCIDDVTFFKTITRRAIQKVWITAAVHALLKTQKATFM